MEIDDEAKPKRRRRAKSDSDRIYFGPKEEEAYLRYMQAETQTERDRIFSQELYAAFARLVECIIRRYYLFVPNETFEETFVDTLSFLLSKIGNFDATKGYKLYSYCGTICRHYLMLRRTQMTKYRNSMLGYDDVFKESDDDGRQIDDAYNERDMIFNEIVLDKVKRQVQEMLQHDQLEERERRVADGLCEMITHRDRVFSRVGGKRFNRASVIYFLTEFTGLPAADVRMGLRKFKPLYEVADKETRSEMLAKGDEYDWASFDIPEDEDWLGANSQNHLDVIDDNARPQMP